jgi:hypothetical protein
MSKLRIEFRIYFVVVDHWFLGEGVLNNLEFDLKVNKIWQKIISHKKWNWIFSNNLSHKKHIKHLAIKILVKLD